MAELPNVAEVMPESEVVSGLWPLFLVGKAIGMMHVTRSGGSSEVTHTYRSMFTPYSIILWFTNAGIFIFAVIILFRSLSSEDTSLVEQFLDLFFHFHITLTQTVCIYQSKYFPGLFREWGVLERKLARLESLVDFKCCKSKPDFVKYFFTLVRTILSRQKSWEKLEKGHWTPPPPVYVHTQQVKSWYFVGSLQASTEANTKFPPGVHACAHLQYANLWLRHSCPHWSCYVLYRYSYTNGF